MYYRLRPVQADPRDLIFFFSCFSDQFQKFPEDFPGEIAAPPVEGKSTTFFRRLQSALIYILLFREGQFLFFIIKVIPVCTFWRRRDQWLMIPENIFVIQIEVVVTDAIVTQGIVKSCIQMVLLTIDFYDIPGMAVFDPFFRIIATDYNHTPDAQRIAQYFHCFCYPFADTYPLA